MVLTPSPNNGKQDEALELRALLQWSTAEGVGPRGLREALRVAGSAQALLVRGDAGLLLGRPSARPVSGSAVEDILRSCREHQIRAIGWHASDYPPALLHLSDPPPVLFVRGALDAAGTAAVAVVGARGASAYGRRMARSLARGLAARAVPVYSGMALGIDGEAHAGAIEGGGTTVAVLGGGVERARPAAHRRLYRQILDGGGAVIGEWPPGTPARPFHFPRRNRLLAALSEVVVVVEAGERSGALSTAAHARRLGREVTAVPGPIDRPGHVGSNRLIRDGCAPILEVRDVLDRVGVVAGPSSRPAQSPAIEGDLAPIWRALEAGPSTLELLAGRVAMPPPRLMEALTRLEIRGLVRRERGLLLRCVGE
jgi:DNA processing protein